MPNKNHCCLVYSYFHNGENAPDCTGVIAESSVRGDENFPEGFFVQTCPRESWLGRTASGIGFCGNGADVVSIHMSAVPSPEQVTLAVDVFKNEDW